MHPYFIYLFFLSILQQWTSPIYNIYIAKIEWHVGIIIEVEDPATGNIAALNDFKDHKIVDIGWGDAEFYQAPPEFDLYLATKAILIPTPSVVRIQGYNEIIPDIIERRDYAFEIQLEKKEYIKLCKFINDSFERDSSDNLIVTSDRYGGQVKFYSSVHKYHAFNTCNTWVAEALEYAGLDVDPTGVLTADNLFNELLGVGKLLKTENE